MAERYTETSKRVIFFARYEARLHGSQSITAEHLLLGLLREGRDLFETLAPFCGEFSPESLKQEVESRLASNERMPKNSELTLSEDVKRVFTLALEEAELSGESVVGPREILVGLIGNRQSIASEILRANGIVIEAVREAFGTSIAFAEEPNPDPISEFLIDLTAEASCGKLDPLIGRHDQVERMIEIIGRRSKNNPVLIGEAGVGKTAIVEGIAQRIASGEVPEFLKNKRILTLDLSLLVAGTKYRGQFEERLKKIVSELKQRPECVVFIDEIHTLIGAGSAEGSLDAANILKPSLARREFQCIGATTPAEYRKSFERDKALERRFQPIRVDAPDEEESIQIISGLVQRYESFHGIRYSDEALVSSVKLTNRYISDRFLPDKAIDALDEAGSRAKLSGSSLVGKREIEEVVSRWTGVPINTIHQDEAKKLLLIEDMLGKKIISQRHAISALARAIKRSRSGLGNPSRPVGSFLFLGPAGVGKTETAKRLAEFLFGSADALVRFDMSEFMERHSVAKLIGSPPGYVGYEEGGRLTEQLRRRPYSVVLIDEVEKAHPDLWNLLLQVLEDGSITDSSGVRTDCRNSIFILTSNIGAREIQNGRNVGFQQFDGQEDSKRRLLVMSEVKRVLPPELTNRLDEIIVFNGLTNSDLALILDLQLSSLSDLLAEREISIEVSESAKSFIINTSCSDRGLGARDLRRGLQRLLEDPISDLVIEEPALSNATISVDSKGNSLDFKLKKRKSRKARSSDSKDH